MPLGEPVGYDSVRQKMSTPLPPGRNSKPKSTKSRRMPRGVYQHRCIVHRLLDKFLFQVKELLNLQFLSKTTGLLITILILFSHYDMF